MLEKQLKIKQQHTVISLYSMLKWSLIEYFLKQNQFHILGEREFLVDASPFPDTEDASETDLAKHDEDDYVEIKEQ